MRTEADVLTDDAQALCPGCMRPVNGDPDFCPSCNAPVGMAAAYCPYRRIWAMAYIYRRGAERPTSLLILCGMILVITRIAAEFLPLTFFLGSSGLLHEKIGFFFLLLCGLAIVAAATIKTIQNYRTIHDAQVDSD